MFASQFYPHAGSRSPGARGGMGMQSQIVISLLSLALLMSLSLNVYQISGRRSQLAVDGGESEISAPGSAIRNSACPATSPLNRGTELHSFIFKALGKMRTSSFPVCVMEVGTADGSGTTHRLVQALDRYCQQTGRYWQVATYEADKELVQKALGVWGSTNAVSVVNELVITPQNLKEYVIPNIQGPSGDSFPGTGFYKNLYQGTNKKVGEGSFGGFFETKPACLVDLVLIDSTRYAHIGIIATIRQKIGLTDADTVWIIENDFWGGGGTERKIIEKYYRLGDVVEAKPAGEQWPWMSFKILGDRIDTDSSSTIDQD